jgi:hypothetical protein
MQDWESSSWEFVRSHPHEIIERGMRKYWRIFCSDKYIALGGITRVPFSGITASMNVMYADASAPRRKFALLSLEE